MKKPCLKCLLADMDLDEYTQKVLEYAKNLPEFERTDDVTYNYRLKLCKQCDELANGICAKCGCFVELRAAKRNSCCASENKLW